MILSFAVTIGLSVLLALSAGRRTTNARDFFAAAGRLGTPLYFLLAVGETYSIGSLLGFPGGIYARGSTLALWFVGYILLAFPIGFILYPRLWRAGAASGAATLPDLFRAHTGSIALERGVGVLLLAVLLPLGASQFIGLQNVVRALGWQHEAPAASLLAAIVALAYVGLAGLRAPARVAALKDALVLGAIAAIAIAALLHWPQNPTAPVASVLRPTASLSNDIFIVSTILTQSIGFCLSPPTVAAVFAARSPDALRRAQIFMPLYMALFPLLLIVATFALTHQPRPHGADEAFLSVAAQLLPDWGTGLVLAGTALSALVVLAGIGLALAAIVTRNIVPHLGDNAQRRWGFTVIAAYFALSALGAAHFQTLLTQLNTLFYLGIAPIIPATLAIAWGRPLAPKRIGTGIAAGLILGLTLRFGDVPLAGMNPALPALLLSGLVTLSK
ncbi:Na+/solute symporter [Neoasaia chiangmaiensis NBRC 101099]|uniref:Uncharacterized protein n=1 Tax=Neoasaia chiangmaiensis TaxID=320497 RepID=A0A1U9KPD4_9PROT|nr:hypothetical protein [Neoasaia chiangmaiensis]AQS87550.1 hypothetical protein A0U93_05930 [Neoasaia chiangmaiensis]GBR42300.1 Na+/solute symporter [Neoasaia chiangmaiensis NBRC 101099]GEN14097.1 hypothetical protein NCH01_05280 [Neoasaia chiangmaiensis]